MKKLIAFVLAFALIFNLMLMRSAINVSKAEELTDILVDENFEFDKLDDPEFLQYLEDSIYAQLEAEYADNESTYQIEDVSAIYISKEYLEELAYNSKSNIFFGYSLADIEEAFQGEKYIFTLSDSGETVVQEYLEIPDDTYDRIVKNVLIGSGVILICVTVTVCTAGAAAPAAASGGTAISSILASTATTTAKVHMIFAASAHSAVTMAASGTVFAGATTMVTRGFETGWDLDAMTKSAAVNASEGFKWGAVSGAVIGGGKEALRIHKAGKGVPTPREAEKAAAELYKGKEQVSYLNGEEVPRGTPGSTRPDIVTANEAIEVKCYDLTHASNLYELRATLTKEISQRVADLPNEMMQRIVLNVEGRGYSTTHVETVVEWLKESLEPIYHDIPIDVMGATL